MIGGGTPIGSSLASFAAALVVAAADALGGRLDAREEVERIRSRRSRISAAAGVSVAYGFVGVLPELAAQRNALAEAAGGDLLFAEQRICLLALLSFVAL